MNDEEYAIVSKKEFDKLRTELEKLKKNPLGGSKQGEDLQDSVDNLSTSLNSMMELFKEASDQMKIEEHDTDILGKKLDPLLEKVDTLIEQNQKIAKGIVAVADMVKEKLESHEAKPEPEPMGLPPGPMGGPLPPGPPMPGPMPAPPRGMPPLPPLGPKKKPILGGFLTK